MPVLKTGILWALPLRERFYLPGRGFAGEKRRREVVLKFSISMKAGSAYACSWWFC